MVQILDNQRQPSLKERFGKSFAQTAQAGSQLIPQVLMQNQENQSLQRLTGKDLGGLSPEMKRIFVERLAKSPEHEKIYNALLAKGVSPEDAELYSILTTGGQTAFVKDILEEKKRGGKFPGQNLLGEEEGEEISPEKMASRELSNFLSQQDEGLTPAERVSRGKERYDTGLKSYQESGTKLRALTRDKQNIEILNSLNESKKLPADLSRLNVDKEGNLRLPFAASSEAQRYVKTLNEFSTGAKDTFGSRVTNFDLSQYLKRYPTLLNSEEGRRQLLQQMKIVNDINSIYYKNLKKTYDKAGGVRRIDTDAAESFAEKMSEQKIDELVQKFNDIGQFTVKPSAKDNKGKKIKNPQTGEVLVSDGENWLPME